VKGRKIHVCPGNTYVIERLRSMWRPVMLGAQRAPKTRTLCLTVSFKCHGMSNEFLPTYWPLGKTGWGLIANYFAASRTPSVQASGRGH
jgi:hypothetical protein